VSAERICFILDLVEKVAGEVVLEGRKKKWKEIAKILKKDEQKICQAIIIYFLSFN